MCKCATKEHVPFPSNCYSTILLSTIIDSYLIFTSTSDLFDFRGPRHSRESKTLGTTLLHQHGTGISIKKGHPRCRLKSATSSCMATRKTEPRLCGWHGLAKGHNSLHIPPHKFGLHPAASPSPPGIARLFGSRANFARGICGRLAKRFFSLGQALPQLSGG